MTTKFKAGQTVYLSDGREAEYVMQNGTDHLVRVMFCADNYYEGYDDPHSYPEDKITSVNKVFLKAPKEKYDKEVQHAREVLAQTQKDLQTVLNELKEANVKKKLIEKESTKYPCIQQVLDFVEGRITHVVVGGSQYSYAEICTLKEVLTDEDKWGGRVSYEGLKLLGLFGTDKHGKQLNWKVNRFRDGSGCWQEIHPARSEAEARDIVRKLLNEALDLWRKGRPYNTWPVNIKTTLERNPWLKAPQDWQDYQNQIENEKRNKKIAELEKEIEKIKSKQIKKDVNNESN